MHKILEFQAVVLAAGRGSRLPDVGGTVTKCLLPVGPYPVLWYSLNSLEKIGFQDALVVVLDEDKSHIENALEQCPLKIKYELIVIPSDEDWGTANSIKHISSRVMTDLLVISGDLISNVDVNDVLNLYRKHDASLVTLFFNNGPEEWIELPGVKLKSKPDRDLVCIDRDTQRLVFLASASDFDERVVLSRLLLKKHDSISMYSRLLDAHLFVVKKWVINFLVDSDRFTSLKGELLPYIVKKQLSKVNSAKHTKGTENINVSSSDITNYAVEHGYESKIRQMSSFNYHLHGTKGAYYNYNIKCYALIPDKRSYGIRVNTLSSFYLANKKIMESWEDIMGTPLTTRVHATSQVMSTQMDGLSTVGAQSNIKKLTSIQNTIIGSNCNIDEKVSLINCILMNNVTIVGPNVLRNTVVYTGATIKKGCNLQYCLVGPHHTVNESTIGNHETFMESSENAITLG